MPLPNDEYYTLDNSIWFALSLSEEYTHSLLFFPFHFSALAKHAVLVRKRTQQSNQEKKKSEWKRRQNIWKKRGTIKNNEELEYIY